MIELFSSLIIAYLLGSIPTAVWIGKCFYDIDVRDHGSGNAGATNVVRVLGVKAGLPVVIIDVLKGYMAVVITRYLCLGDHASVFSVYILVAAASLAVIGHTLPVFARFRGGKGVATLLGVGIGLFPAAAWSALGIFIIVLILTKYVSLSSITAGISFPIMVFTIFPPKPEHWLLYTLSIVVAVFLPYTHRKNIQRLIKGTESKINFSKAKKTKSEYQ